MLKRPIDPRFKEAVLEGRKFTTIRENAWPIGPPIMLFHWAGKPYRSKHVNVAPIVVMGFWRITIERTEDDVMHYTYGMENAKPIHETEGFNSSEEMDEWFRELVKKPGTITKTLMRFRLADAEGAVGTSSAEEKVRGLLRNAFLNSYGSPNLELQRELATAIGMNAARELVVDDVEWFDNEIQE